MIYNLDPDQDEVENRSVPPKKEESFNFLDVMDAAWEKRKFSDGENAKVEVRDELLKQRAKEFESATGENYYDKVKKYRETEDPVFKNTKVGDPLSMLTSNFEDGTGIPGASVDPSMDPRDVRDIELQIQERFLEKFKRENPALGKSLKSREEIEAMIPAVAKKYRDNYVNVISNSPDNWSNMGAEFLGAGAAVLTEETNVKSMLFGAARGASILAKMAIEGGLNATAEILTLEERANFRKEQGEPMTYEEAALDVGMAFGFGAALTGVVAGGSKILGMDQASQMNKIARKMRELGEDDAARIVEFEADRTATEGYDLTRYSDEVSSAEARSVFDAAKKAFEDPEGKIDTTRIDLPDRVFDNIDTTKIENPLVRSQVELIQKISKSFDEPVQDIKLTKSEREMVGSMLPEEKVDMIDGKEIDPIKDQQSRADNFSSEARDSQRIAEAKKTGSKASRDATERYLQKEGADFGPIEGVEKTLTRTRKKLEAMMNCKVRT